jgi:hypothetical protein
VIPTGGEIEMTNWREEIAAGFRILSKVASIALVEGALVTLFAASPPVTWHGMVRDAQGHGVGDAQVELRGERGGPLLRATTNADGAFTFAVVPAGVYQVLVQWRGRTARNEQPLEVRAGERVAVSLEISADGQGLAVRAGGNASLSPEAEQPGLSGAAGLQGSGGQRLSSKEVSSLPLNQRDFSQLLLLASGTKTDTNVTSNYTQQFAVNGQRGTTAVFAIDGIFASDPEIGGATFRNFNVEAVQQIRASSGVMPAEIGAGAASYTDIVTKSGTSQIHGEAFSFVRNAAFDARNFFDRRSFAQPGRIPPFVRNEFGFTNGGPVVLPGVYDGRGRTYYFAEYQGFRQVLGTTQVFPVPTAAERQGYDTTAYPGDTLVVPISPQIAPVLAGYPLPNDPGGSYGARTYAISSKVATNANQFSMRIDHRISDKAQLFLRFTLDDFAGPTTNPDQTAINLTFGQIYYDHQRDLGLTYTRTISPLMTSETSLGFIRTTPDYVAPNLTQPGITFADNLYEPYNSAAGTVSATFSNLLQLRQNFTYVHGTHTFKWGAEVRLNRDTGRRGSSPDGVYTFGGGPAYAQKDIPSLSGTHAIHAGDQLPDTLTGFLTGAAESYTIGVAPAMFPQGTAMGDLAVRREAYNFFFQDAWKVTPRLVVNYGLRYEVTTLLHTEHKLDSGPAIVQPDGRPARPWDPGAQVRYLVNLQPPYKPDWNGWGPRLSLAWRASDKTVLHAGGAITTLLMNLASQNLVIGGTPVVISPLLIAAPGEPIAFANKVTPLTLPVMYTTAGQPMFPPGQSTDKLASNTVFDIARFTKDLAAMTGQPFRPYRMGGMATNFGNGYIETYTAGLEHEFDDLKVGAYYVGTAGVGLAQASVVNGYNNASPEFAPFTVFDSSGRAVGGAGPVLLMTSGAHSTFHSLQVGLAKTSSRAGLGFHANYTLSKSLDTASSSLPGGFGGPASGLTTVIQAPVQDPRYSDADKGPSIFDIRQAFSISLFQKLPFDRMNFLRPLGQKATSGWQLISISTLASGLPFSVYSGMQQTGAGVDGADRPDQAGQPHFSTSRKTREDYFGLGAANSSFFSIPIGLSNGTGPNSGTFGTLGRDTFRGPDYHDFDVALTKDTELAHRKNGEPLRLQFRAEFFNVFNLVNFSLPSNVLAGSGFGYISQTNGTSRQIQLSLKLFY